jgi:hypothetical protein
MKTPHDVKSGEFFILFPIENAIHLGKKIFI